MKFADPKNDVAFRKIFGDEMRKDILISFLNALLDYNGTEKEIQGIVIADPYQIPRLQELKHTILDLKAVDKRGVRYIVEMQVFHTAAFEKRVLYYTSKAYVNQLGRAEGYPLLNQVLFIGFLDFTLFQDDPRYQTRHLILEENSREHYIKDFEFHLIELPKFTKELDQLGGIKDKWIYFIKNAAGLTLIPRELSSPKELKQAFECANQLSWTREELDAYDLKGMYIQDERGRVELAQAKGLEKGLEKGMVEGEKIGIEKGRRKGEFDTIRKVALTMLNAGFERSDIAKATGLTSEEISRLS